MDGSIWIAFVTGLTAGGLSCMAVQGGLVTSTLVGHAEDMAGLRPIKAKAKINQQQPQLALPIIIFLAAKLVAYTMLGILLGALGSLVGLSPQARGILQIAIALFMLANALRLFNVHPFFRHFSFEPPARIRRLLRQKSKSKDNVLTPVILGILTVLIPCGVTQAMMALAISTGSALQGGILMFAFTLGASPVFFLLTYLATRLGKLTEKYFTRLVALALLVFGLISIDSGLNLVGFPYTIGRLTQQAQAANITTVPGIGQRTVLNPASSQPASGNDVFIQVENEGYSPYRSVAKADQPVRIHLETNEVYSCTRSFVIPSLNIQKLLYANGVETIDIEPQKAGTELQYTCSMGMYSGVIVFQ